MENNTIVIDSKNGDVSYEYVEPIINNEPELINYEQRVIELIRHKYSVNQELAILRQKDDKPDEYDEYFNYCEECKLQARRESGQDSAL